MRSSPPSDRHRRTGRTTAMVKLLPWGGCTVVVHSMDFAGYVRDLIRHHRGPMFKGVHIVPIISARRQLIGTRLPIFIDHHVFNHVWNSPRMRDDLDWILDYARIVEFRLSSR